MICTYNDITYTLAKSDRKTMSIYVEPNGTILVRAPKYIPQEKLNAILGLKKYWIHKSIAELQELNRTKVTRQIAHGEGFLFMGKSCRLKIDKNLKKPLSLVQGYFILHTDEIENAREHFINFYREKGREYIPTRVEYFKKKIGVEPKNIRVMDLKNRWASQSRNGVNFHWKLMLAPMTIIDYIVVHELAHLNVQDHSPAFWELVESVMPNYDERKNWLKINGANLDI